MNHLDPDAASGPSRGNYPLSAPGKPRPVSVDSARLRLTNPDGTEGILLGVRCGDCGIHSFGPATFCQACTSANLEPVELGKQGTLYSYTVVRVPPPGWTGPVPYILGQVELPEGPHLLAEVIDCPEGELKIGMGVQLALQSVKGTQPNVEKVVYKWRPAPPDPAAKEDRP